MDKSDKLVAINQTLPGLESFLREVLGKEGLSSDAEQQRQEFIKRLETISTPPALPPRPPRLAARAQLLNDSGSKIQDEEDLFTNSLYRNDTFDDPVAFASHQRELSRHYTFSRGYVGRRDLFGEGSPLYSSQPPVTQPTLPVHRNSIQSCSSDEIYERLSIGEAYKPGEGTSDVLEKETSAVSTPAPNLGQRGGTGRGSGGKGKITSGWFKKETKPQTEVHLQDIQDPIIQGYLRDVKSNKRRWCVLKDEKLYIFKSRDEPTNQIIDLPNCDIGVDDKKKISYSFRLQQTGAPLVQLAIEEGHDLSPWMSAIMAAAVRRSKTFRPTSPLDNACSLEEAQGKARSPFGYMRIDIRQEEEENGDRSSTYEVPLELLPEMISSSGYTPFTSTPTRSPPDAENQAPYNPPLPPLPINSDSSSESSSDEEEDDEDEAVRKTRKERKSSRANVIEKDTKTLDSHAEGDENRRSFHEDSHGTESPSDQSISHLSFGETMAGDEAAEVRGERSGSLQRKRTSTVLSNVSLESTGSNQDLTQKEQDPPRKLSMTSGPRMKRRRKQTSAEMETKFLQDPNAVHSGILFQKRPLGVWSKRYCKLVADKLLCYRHADDEKPSLMIILKDQDVSLTDSKESRKAYAFKVGRPGQESYFFGTDSRVSVERWIELLSLASTGRQDIMAPYPPYFKSGSGDELSKSRESLSLSEDVDSGDTLEFIDSSSTNTPTSSRDGYPYEDIDNFAADELDGDISSDARESHSHRSKNRSRRVKSPNRRSPRHHTKGGVRDRAMKRKKEKQNRTGSNAESPYTTSPTQSGVVSDSGGESRPEGTDEAGLATTAAENRVSSADPKKDKKGWAESLKLKQSRFTRGHSLSSIITGTPISEISKTRLHAIKKTNIQSYTHLLSLFDKEGRFSGFLTEVKVSKYSTTQLRRWCVVKNGALNLYNKQTEEIPAVKLNLAEMWLTESVDEGKHKYSFNLHDKDGKTYTFQVPSKEEFNKWYGILRVFTEIRIERPVQASVADDTEKSPTQYRRDVGVQKPDRPVSKGKDDGTSVNTFVKRPSIRMKISQKVSVMDIFKRSHSSYDFENPVLGDIIPTDDIKVINYTGGQLTEVCVTEDHYTWSRARWCTIKDSEFLVFADNVGGDPVKRIPLYNVRIEEACETDKEVYRFKIHKAHDTLIFVANSKPDYDRWVTQLRSASSMYGKGDHENSKCRIPSPRVFSHRRSRSETLPQVLGGTPSSGVSSSASSPEKRLSYGSTSVSTGSEGSTDTLMNGHLDEIIPNRTDKSLDKKSKWCVVTSEFFFQYDSEDVTNPSRKWKLKDITVKEEKNISFALQCGGETVFYCHENQEVISQWLSVLYRYCIPTDDDISPVLPRKDSRRFKAKISLSQDNIKTDSPDQEKRFLRKTLSEGKASGRKLLRKISEDNLLHKYRRAEVFKVPWKGSLERLNVKFRDRDRDRDSAEAYVNARDIERRFSCGSIFDSEGKYSGYLVELVTRPLCRSEIRRWCVVRDDCFYVYEQPRVDTPRKIIQLKHVLLVNELNVEENKFVFRLDYGAEESAVFKAVSRNDFEKWITAISVKLAVLKSRIEREERRRGFVIDEDEEFTPSESTPPVTKDNLTPTTSTYTRPSDDTRYLEPLPRRESDVSNDSVFIREQATTASTTPSAATEVRTEGEARSVDDADSKENSRSDKEVSEILQALEKVTLGDFYTPKALADAPMGDDDVINLGTVKVPWSAVIAEAREGEQDQFETEPIYQNSTILEERAEVEPVYQNTREVFSEGSTGTLSQLEVEQIDLNSHEGRMNYRRFKEGYLANPEESMFVDMLPKRHSEYDLGPLYDNLHFLQNQEPQGKPLWSVRTSKDHDDVFAASGHTSMKTPKEFSTLDRRSMASDYSGIVGESLLEEVGSYSGNTSRSGTLSSQSGIDPRDLQSMDSAFDKELLEDILGLDVTSEEAAEISEYCVKCDEEQDCLASVDTRSDTLTDRQSKSDVFFDAASEFEDPNTETNDRTTTHDQAHAYLGGDLRSSSEASILDTYFGRSSSDDDDEVYEDSSQGFLTADSSPCHRPLSAAINLDLNEERESRDKLTTDFVNNLDRQFRGESSEESQNRSVEAQQDESSQFQDVDEAIVSVGAVLPSDDREVFLSAQSRFANCLNDTKSTNIRPHQTNQASHQEVTNSCEDINETEAIILRDKSGIIDGAARKELTKSEVEFIKAVTDAFQDITKLSLEDDGSEDTKL